MVNIIWQDNIQTKKHYGVIARQNDDRYPLSLALSQNNALQILYGPYEDHLTHHIPSASFK